MGAWVSLSEPQPHSSTHRTALLLTNSKKESTHHANRANDIGLAVTQQLHVSSSEIQNTSLQLSSHGNVTEYLTFLWKTQEKL